MSSKSLMALAIYAGRSRGTQRPPFASGHHVSDARSNSSSPNAMSPHPSGQLGGNPDLNGGYAGRWRADA